MTLRNGRQDLQLCSLCQKLVLRQDFSVHLGTELEQRCQPRAPRVQAVNLKNIAQVGAALCILSALRMRHMEKKISSCTQLPTMRPR